MVETAPPPLLRRTQNGRAKNRYGLLDGLRFGAAFVVLAFHYTARETSAWTVPVAERAPGLFDVTKYGVLGVDLFFVISGFVILMTAWDRSLPDFTASRVARLFPAYWVCVLLTAAVLVLDGANLMTSRVLVNLTMVQSAFAVPHVDGVYWTLWVEMRFYALMALFILVGITKNRIICFAVLWPVVGAIAETTHLDFLAYALVWQHAALFAGGMLLFVIVREGHSLVLWLAFAADVLMAFASSAPELAARISSTSGAGVPSTAAWGGVLLCYALVALVTLTPLRRVSWKWLSVAGALTYPLYLLHEQIGWAVIRHTEQLGWVPAATLATLVSLALAIGVHYLVERRGGPALRRAIRKGFGDAPPTTVESAPRSTSR